MFNLKFHVPSTVQISIIVWYLVGLGKRTLLKFKFRKLRFAKFVWVIYPQYPEMHLLFEVFKTSLMLKDRPSLCVIVNVYFVF